eukprot:CAMPEP_0198146242 /NCGR_PEP_ID=MMETSP1443-20131203/28307_1 /TAXON_ID=186043 /ORGANISM="Entomoneis sp., Strain CCMP2396" /LENGTH=67 /DNA_ID=CAMNT_0043810131 /DNA_START=55 /DNA_END=258 /DNA_ORIENTATION=-
MNPAPATTFWRIAGLSYLQYVNKAAGSIRSALKEPAKRKAMAQDKYYYKKSTWTAGEMGPKTECGAL